MSAITQDIVRDFDTLPQLAPTEAHIQKAASRIYAGGLAMQVAGVCQDYVGPVPAGALLLGIPNQGYPTDAGVVINKVYPTDRPMIFTHGLYWFRGLDGDLPTEALLNVPGGVTFTDNNTVQATPSATLLTATLLAIRGAIYKVLV